MLAGLRHFNEFARKNAAEAIGKAGITKPEFITALLRAMLDENDLVQSAAFESLLSLGNEKPKAVSSALTVTLKDESARLRVKAATILGHLSNTNSIVALRESLQDEDVDVRRAVAYALEKLGVFDEQETGRIQIFLSYSREDQPRVMVLYQKLVAAGYQPWLDREHIVPGQRWEPVIKQALQQSDFMLVCLSATSINKRGFLQKEIKQALEFAEERLDDDVWLIPARLDDCEIPESLSAIQWVDLFEKDGFEQLLRAIEFQLKKAGKSIPRQAASPMSIEIFLSYSHRDESLRDKLSKHLSILKRQGVINEWHDRQIDSGKEWKGVIDTRIEQAKVILLLISADFLASGYYLEIEMKRALERHENGDAIVIPIILHDCLWEDALFGKLQALPKDARPVTSWSNQDEAFQNVAEGIRGAIETLLANDKGGVKPTRADAMREQSWDQIELAYNQGVNIRGRVIDQIKGGLRVDIGGIQAFLPSNQVDVRPLRNLDSFRNKEIEVRVLKVNKKRGNVVLSRKIVLEEQLSGKKVETLRHLEEGIIVEGQVNKITEYGAFIDLGGLDGLLHITDMSWERIQHPNELFKVGETVQVMVLKFDRDKERVSLGYKQLIPDPWATVVERFPVGTRVKGKVVSLADYGAFIELEPGIEGLVHVSEMSWYKRVKHPSNILSVGQEVEAVVLEVDSNSRQISLGLKQIEANPWETLAQRYGIGTRIKGRVRNLTDFGAFIEIEEGIDGLVHVSDISWTKRIKHPSEALKKNQEVEAVITAIDVENRRLSLSIKDLEPNAWDRFFDTHRLGDVVTGKITRFANFGAFVEIEEGIEGLCHVSELSENHVDKPEDAVGQGQKMQFKILKMDREARKIGLSARAVGKDEPIVDSRNYSSGESGMASLFEVADFNKSSEEES